MVARRLPSVPLGSYPDRTHAGRHSPHRSAPCTVPVGPVNSGCVNLALGLVARDRLRNGTPRTRISTGTRRGRRPGNPPRSLLSVGLRHWPARSGRLRLAAGARSVIRPPGPLASTWLGAVAPLVDVAQPLLDRRLPLLPRRRDVLDHAPGVEAQFLGHTHRLVGQSASSLCLCPELLLTLFLRLHHCPSLSYSSRTTSGPHWSR